MSREEPKLTFADLHSTKLMKEASPHPLEELFEKEKVVVTDAIVKAFNAAEPLPWKMYSFTHLLDGANIKGYLYVLWNQWLSDIRKQYPQLPKMRVEIPMYDEMTMTSPMKPYIARYHI